VGEGTIADPLAQVARAHRGLSLGSYPFFDAERKAYGSNLVTGGGARRRWRRRRGAVVGAGEAGVTDVRPLD
jgi:hypothetical protein